MDDLIEQDNMVSGPFLEQMPTESPLYFDSQNRSFLVVSTMAYLIGVEQQHFYLENESGLAKETYDTLSKDKNARIVRNLCRIRTALERFYGSIQQAFRYDIKNIGSLPDLIPTEAVTELAADGVSLYRSRPDVDDYLIAINKEMSNRINSIKGLLPDWLKWDYIKQLFIMPNGMKKVGLKAAGAAYNADRNAYPYQCYINWTGGANGNLLYSDEKFVTLLYESHEDYFDDISLVRTADQDTRHSVYDFLEESHKAIVVVDCENSNPIKLAAALSSLSAASVQKISKIILFDGEYTTSGWQILSKSGNFPIEHITVPRLVEHKSQVDMTLAARTCREVYRNDVDSVILVSSDSDYWALIQSMADISFLVMVEEEKCGASIREVLRQRGIYYCYLDDFCTGVSYNIKTATVTAELQRYLDETVQINMEEALENALKATWMQMTLRERQAYCERYIWTMRIVFEEGGKLRLMLGEK